MAILNELKREDGVTVAYYAKRGDKFAAVNPADDTVFVEANTPGEMVAAAHLMNIAVYGNREAALKVAV